MTKSEKLEDVLMRLHGISREEALSRIDRCKYLIESGNVTPGEVLTEEYGTDMLYLEKLLSPVNSSDVSE